MIFTNFFYGQTNNMMPYSAFHIVFMIFFTIVTFGVSILCHNCKDKTFRIIILVCWAILVLFEIGKQFNWGTDLQTRKFVGFDIQAFPYQFCSLVFYLLPFSALLPESKWRNMLNAFVGTFLFLTGFGYIFVGSSLCSRVFICHQTMIHHGIQGTVSLLIFTHEFKKLDFMTFVKGAILLPILTAIAIVLNIVLTKADPRGVNLWELNPIEGYRSTVPIYKKIFEATNYPVFILIYLILFFSLGTAFYWIETLFHRLFLKVVENRKNALAN